MPQERWFHYGNYTALSGTIFEGPYYRELYSPLRGYIFLIGELK